ncbi:MAG: transcriptional regulator [Clostridiaceae bacterium]|nr:transcriptional regulator [Clostridiaceae bacterium]
MFYYLLNRNKTIKQLRKDASLTIKELAALLKCNEAQLGEIEPYKLKHIPKEMRYKLIPIFRGDKYDNIPW